MGLCQVAKGGALSLSSSPLLSSSESPSPPPNPPLLMAKAELW